MQCAHTIRSCTRDDVEMYDACVFEIILAVKSEKCDSEMECEIGTYLEARMISGTRVNAHVYSQRCHTMSAEGYSGQHHSRNKEISFPKSLINIVHSPQQDATLRTP
jgi:hypothetical protein